MARHRRVVGQYCNHTGINVGPHECTLTFGVQRCEPIDGRQIWTVDTTQTVTLPLTTAKNLLFALRAHILAHERVYGRTHVSPALRAPLPTNEGYGLEGLAHLALLHADLFGPDETAGDGFEGLKPGIAH